MKITKVLLNPRMLAATLVTMVLAAAITAQAQDKDTFAVAYDISPGDGITLHGLALTGDVVIYGDFLTVSSALSVTRVNESDFSGSRTYVGVGPGVRFSTGKRLQIFGQALYGRLNANLEVEDLSVDIGVSSYGYRYGGGFDFAVSDRGSIRVGVDYDGRNHLMVGGSVRF